MGNLCCKRQRNQQNHESVWYSSENEPESSSSETHSDEIHPSDNNLEQYLNDVYEKECVLKASQEEVEFIQTEIETLVQQIVDEVLNLFSEKFKVEIFHKEENKSEIANYFERDLIEVYFPRKSRSHFQDLTIKYAKSSIIKVGSFYEGTKNNFPDEFDFIFLLFCRRYILHGYSLSEIRSAVCSCIESAVCSCIESVKNKKAFHYADPNSRIYLNTGKHLYRHGPAYMLEFIYKTDSTKERHIAIDLVPAYKIVVDNQQDDWYMTYVNDNVKPKSFRDEIMSAESCNYVGDSISFIETEVAFMRNVLSESHRKVYRILKSLINGHGDDEIMKECLILQERRESLNEFRQPYKPCSSYQIKTMMIYHHDECRNSDTTDIGPCVLQILEKMCQYKHVDKFPAFSDYIHTPGLYLVEYLQSLIETLNSLQTRTDRYSYKRYKTVSVTMQYLEREHMDWLNKHKKYKKILSE